MMLNWLNDYATNYKKVIDSIPLEKVEEIAKQDDNVRMMLDFLDASERGWIR